MTSITSSLNQALGTLKSALSTQGTQSKVTATVGFKDSLGNAVTASSASTATVFDSTFAKANALQIGDVVTVALQTVSSTGFATTLGTTGLTITAGTTVKNLLDFYNNNTTYNTAGASQTLSAYLSDSGNLVVESTLAGQQSNTSTTQTFALQVGLNTQARTGTGLTGQYVSSVFNFSGGVGNTVALTSVTSTNQTGQIVSGTTQQTTRSAAATAFRSVLQQISQSAGDAGYNGSNLLNGDFLTTYTNDTQSASIVTQGSVINSTNLGFSTDVVIAGNTFANLQAYTGDAVRNLQSDTEIKSAITKLNNALGTVTQFATNLATNTNLLQNRQVFTTSTIRNFTNGADQLTLADINQEGANLSSLQTKQQLAVQALSLANRSDQSILRLFG